MNANLSFVLALLFALPLDAQRPTGTIITSNMNDSSTSVIDAASERVIATLPTGAGPHEVAISHDGHWAVVSNYGVRGKPGQSLTVIDVDAHAMVRTIDLLNYQRPHGMAFLSGDSVLAVTSEAARMILLVDFRRGTVMRTLPTRGRTTHMVAASRDGETMVTANIADGTITLLHPLAAADSGTLITVAAQPEGIAITPDGRQAWVGSDRDSIVVIIDLSTRAVIDTLRGFGLPYRLAITSDGRRAIITDPVRAEVRIYDVATRRQERVITIARDSLVPTAEVSGSPSPEGVAVGGEPRWAFVTLQGRNRIITIDLSTGTIVGTAVTGAWSDGVGFSSRRSKP